MNTRTTGEVIKRYEGNPIIQASDLPYPCNSVFNPAATMFDGKYLILMRVEVRDGTSMRLALATSPDGFTFDIQPELVMFVSEQEPFKTYEALAISDPRITQMGEDYYITYAAYSVYGVRIGIARTKDFRKIERVSLASVTDNRNAVLFPEKINGLYVRLERPFPDDPRGLSVSGNIWISYSPDLIYWGQSRILMTGRPTLWDQNKIGPGAPPIKTEKGWLEIYHGVRLTADGCIYRAGVVLLDLNDPARIIARPRDYLLSPTEIYERLGDVPNVVFPCGAVLDSETGQVKIYYGAADQCICVATTDVDALLRFCLG